MTTRFLWKNHKGIFKLFEVNRAKNDLYINQYDNGRTDHFTYHGSGESGYRQEPKKVYTSHWPQFITRRPPLVDYEDTESIMSYWMILGVGAHPMLLVQPRTQDVVFEFEPPFEIDVVISGDPAPAYTPRNDRDNSSVYKLSDVPPMCSLKFMCHQAGSPSVIDIQKSMMRNQEHLRTSER